jgi:hypothetical protein
MSIRKSTYLFIENVWFYNKFFIYIFIWLIPLPSVVALILKHWGHRSVCLAILGFGMLENSFKIHIVICLPTLPFTFHICSNSRNLNLKLRNFRKLLYRFWIKLLQYFWMQNIQVYTVLKFLGSIKNMVMKCMVPWWNGSGVHNSPLLCAVCCIAVNLPFFKSKILRTTNMKVSSLPVFPWHLYSVALLQQYMHGTFFLSGGT